VRIVWDDNENRFLAELTPGEQWRDDMEAVKSAGFRTTGPPDWQWYAGTIETLENIRKHPPKSGLLITEQALQKYKPLLEKFQQKQELRKQFKRAQKIAKKSEKLSEPEMFFGAELGIMCLVVKPTQTAFVSTFTRPEPPKDRCLLCDEPLYWPLDGPTFCAWCEIENKT